MRQGRKGLNRAIFWLYHGEGRGPFLFRWAILILDFVSIAFFLWEPFHSWRGALHKHWLVQVDLLIAIYIALDFSARLYIAQSWKRFFRDPYNLADLGVVLTLVAPLFFENLVFLRVLRMLRIVRTFTFLRRAESVSGFLERHRVVIERIINFVVFLFIMSALVYVNQVGREGSAIRTQMDALYFTVTSLTTTGYGDVLLVGQDGRILSIVVMILGLTLFVRLLQAVVSPEKKVTNACTACGLDRHETDAVHCKRCGAILRIGSSETASRNRSPRVAGPTSPPAAPSKFPAK